MAKENAVLSEIETLEEELTESFDLNELEEKLQNELEKELSDLEFLKEEKDKIGNPDALGKVVMDEVWRQFTNQVGLEVTNETLIQKYDKEHPETYKEVGKTVMQALSSMLKEIINALIRFFKSTTKSIKTFLDEMKKAVKNFFFQILNFLQAGANSVVGTIVTEIFGPVVSMFKKLASFIKQGLSSFIEAIQYLTNKENANKPFSIKVLEVGKIITAGIMAGGALVLGEVFEKLLMSVPFMAIEIPLFGSLANIFGIFFVAILCGVVGAIFMNLLDKAIENKSR